VTGVIGSKENPFSNVAVYWKNGQVVQLGAAIPASYADGTDVYVCGNTNNGSSYVSTVWKNGQLLPIQTAASGPLFAWGIGIGNGAVYVGGNERAPGQAIAAYWSAGGVVELDKNPAQSSNVWGIFVK
jgi:hypothetical protein